jgi:hypothetical protein
MTDKAETLNFEETLEALHPWIGSSVGVLVVPSDLPGLLLPQATLAGVLERVDLDHFALKAKPRAPLDRWDHLVQSALDGEAGETLFFQLRSPVEKHVNERFGGSGDLGATGFFLSRARFGGATPLREGRTLSINQGGMDISVSLVRGAQ